MADRKVFLDVITHTQPAYQTEMPEEDVYDFLVDHEHVGDMSVYVYKNKANRNKGVAEYALHRVGKTVQKQYFEKEWRKRNYTVFSEIVSPHEESSDDQ